MRVIIIGAGGHARVVADILLQRRSEGIDPAGFLDVDTALRGQLHFGLPVLGSIDDVPRFAHDAVIVAIGENVVRRRLYLELAARGERFFTACHPSAVTGSDVTIAPGSMICAGAVVNCGSVIGLNTILNTGCSIDHDNIIGDHVHVAPGAHTGGGVRIGEGTLIGIGAIVLPGRTIGAGALIGAGAVVCDDVPERVVAMGTPARTVRTLGEGEGHL